MHYHGAAICALVYLVNSALAQSGTLGLSDGFLSLDTPSFSVQLVKDSQTLYSLRPTGAGSFDFIPYDKMDARQADGNYHLGDITFRARAVGSSAWASGDTSASRKKVTAISVSGTNLSAANLAPTLPEDSLLNITRRWVVDDGQFELLFDITNTQKVAVEIGALGTPLEFNNIFTGRTAADTNENSSLFDPYIGSGAGYVQVTPLLGTLPPLVVVPVGQSPLEGWRFLPEDTSTSLGYQSQTFEGLYEWQFHTLAYAQNEWADVSPWNAPTSAVLQPGETRTYGLQFRLASSIRGIEDELLSAGRPVAVGIPGYILSEDIAGRLYLNYTASVQSISVTPASALSVAEDPDSSPPGWVAYTVNGTSWGRSRISVNYTDGTTQTVHYYVTKPAAQAISDLGTFLTTAQWFNDSSDPFSRSPSVISYDRQVNAVVKDEARAWIAGLSDEAGAGSWLAATMKQFAQPSASEVAQLEEFIDKTVSGTIQNANGTSVYFYQPDAVPNYTYPSDIDYSQWWSWNVAAAYATDRAYDYVHVLSAYWAIYRVARNYPDTTKLHTWQWYIDKAVATVATMTDGAVGYADDGLMEETVIRYLLQDLKREGLEANATLVEARMRARENVWAGERYPFGSEMAWDSTGQEGVYAWATYFNDTTTATNVINSILAYQPSIPHWGYNGNARRYWDNVYGGKLQRIERQIHHYGSGLNAIPLITQFRSSPDDYYLLRVGFAGISGPLSNIDQDGFASASFHSFADTLAWDAYSGDYGPNFVGHALEIGTYLIDHPTFGWQAFGGNVVATSPTVNVLPRDSLRRRIFISPLGTLLTLDAGAFSAFSYDPSAKTLQVTVVPAAEGAINAAAAPHGRLVVEQIVAGGAGVLVPTGNLTVDAGAYVVPFTSGVAQVMLKPS
ncbi:hypothetical protein PLICRDRAFT_50293 [Plicaturopsis crispa FD-325 SS-3]|nr:hypothetical protein PLICRDRAFT_50293 [Plicaturopsis crispa FD-325 SS-3]